MVPTQIVEEIRRGYVRVHITIQRSQREVSHTDVRHRRQALRQCLKATEKAARKNAREFLRSRQIAAQAVRDSPACIEYCPIEACMFWVPDEDHPPFGRIEVDPYLCIGCQKCTSKGPDGAFLDGCPWDAIEMVPTDDWESLHGIVLPDLPPAPPTS